MSAAEAVLHEVLEAFDFGAPVIETQRYGCGHINDTFCVRTREGANTCRCFILQRMSPVAFRNPDQLMKNIVGITEYLGEQIAASGGDRRREALQVIKPRSGRDYYTDSRGGGVFAMGSQADDAGVRHPFSHGLSVGGYLFPY